METISNLLKQIAETIWGTPLVVLLIGGGAYLLLVSKFIPFRGFGTALRLITMKKSDSDSSSQGQLSHFEALSNSLAATVGLGNISGVAVAISQGGPGAIFWMWVAAMIGMNTKFFESTLSIMYRGKDYKGEVQGGPMYIISKGLPKTFKPLAIFTAICGVIVFSGVFTTNQITAYFHFEYAIPKIYIGVFVAIISLYVLKGGIQKIAMFSSRLVPLMSTFYLLGGSIICAQNYQKIFPLLKAIVLEAFSIQSVFGGVSGLSIIAIIQIGFRRAALSNEAGIGTASMAHGNAKTNEPVKEGLVAMLGPFLDTVVICTMTAFIILLGLKTSEIENLKGIVMVTQSFNYAFPTVGTLLISISVFLFGFTTVIGLANFALKCWDFLFQGRWGLKDNVFNLWYCFTIIIGSISSLGIAINIVDIVYGLLALVNMIAILALSKKVKKEIASFFHINNI